MDKVTHFELHADDVSRAQKFYKDIFGWEINSSDPNYFLINTVPVDKKGMPK